MTDSEKLNRLSVLLDMDEESAILAEYLNMAKDEILNWMYRGDVPEGADVPARYEQTQIQAVIAGYSISGAEGQTSHSENGISRTFKYPDMLAYIHSHVIPLVQIL